MLSTAELLTLEPLLCDHEIVYSFHHVDAASFFTAQGVISFGYCRYSRSCSCIQILYCTLLKNASAIKRNMISILLVVLVAILHAETVVGYSIITSRRAWIQSFGIGIISSEITFPMVSNAASKPAAPAESPPLGRLIEAQETLDKLLQNWKRATVDCTFADVPRELLETKNKELLLEKASTFALFDKSVSVETCKTTNKIVRDYLGATGIGPLVGIDKQLRKAFDFIDPEDLDDYVTESEAFSQAISKASSLSYTAGVADFDSVNNFAKADADKTNKNSNLEQTRAAIGEAKSNLDRMVAMLQKAQS